MRNISSLQLGFILALTLIAGGCSTQLPRPAAGKPGTEAAFNVAPKQMADFVKRVLATPPALAVESEDKGVLTTGWQRFPGEWHVARRWKERTRYFITIIPDWDEPNAKCRLLVNADTQQRAADGQDWEPASELNRTDRADALLKRLRDAASAGTAGA